MSPGQSLPWFPQYTADDPFVRCLGITTCAARLMRLCEFVSGGIALYCAQSAGFSSIVAYLPRRPLGDWRQMRDGARLFWSLSGTDELARHGRLSKKSVPPAAFEKVSSADTHTALSDIPDNDGHRDSA